MVGHLIKTSTYESPISIYRNTIAFCTLCLLYTTMIFSVLLASLILIRKLILRNRDLESMKRETQPVKNSLLLKHFIINLCMCSALNYFAFNFLNLTTEYYKCADVFISFIKMVDSLIIFEISYFFS